MKSKKRPSTWISSEKLNFYLKAPLNNAATNRPARPGSSVSTCITKYGVICNKEEWWLSKWLAMFLGMHLNVGPTRPLESCAVMQGCKNTYHTTPLFLRLLFLPFFQFCFVRLITPEIETPSDKKFWVVEKRQFGNRQQEIPKLFMVLGSCCLLMYLVISHLVLRAGCGIWLYQFLIIADLFILIFLNKVQWLSWIVIRYMINSLVSSITF